tara:strand:- start:1656 stop:2231 length:576 start_codon:yes stop_codon:yes gene_type:complete
MADTLRMSFSLTAVEEVGAGNSQTHTVIDSVAQRTWGGSMNRVYNAGVDSDKICVWENSVVTVQDAALDFTNGLDASAWTEASDVTRGTIPSLAKVLAVEYKSAIGSANNYVYVYWGEEGSGSEKHCFAKLSVGEGCVIPLEETVAYNAAFTGAADSVSAGGVDPEKLHITCNDYDNGTNEATINVLLAGR